MEEQNGSENQNGKWQTAMNDPSGLPYRSLPVLVINWQLQTRIYYCLVIVVYPPPPILTIGNAVISYKYMCKQFPKQCNCGFSWVCYCRSSVSVCGHYIAAISVLLWSSPLYPLIISSLSDTILLNPEKIIDQPQAIQEFDQTVQPLD